MATYKINTYADIKNRALNQADLPSGYANNIKSDALDDLVDESIAELWDILVRVYDDDMPQESRNLTVLAGEGKYAWIDTYYSTLPYHIMRVEYAGSNGDKIPLERFHQGAYVHENQTRDWASCTPRYDYRFGAMHFHPVNTSNETIVIHYIPIPPTPTTDTEQLHPLLNLHANYLVYATAIKLRMKADMATAGLERLKAEYVDALFKRMTSVDMFRALAIPDADYEVDEPRFDYD